jgi:hypothetical protein
MHFSFFQDFEGGLQVELRLSNLFYKPKRPEVGTWAIAQTSN